MLHLLPQLPVLKPDALDQRPELLVGFPFLRRLQVDAVDGLHHVPGRFGGQKQRQRRHGGQGGQGGQGRRPE